MAENHNPSLAELNEAIAREHGIDPATLKDYRLPDIPVARAEDVPFGKPILLRSVPGTTAQPVPALEIPPPIEPDFSVHQQPDLPAAPEPPAARPKVRALSDRPESSCFAWTPRQMLQSFIDAIDRGEEVPKAMIITYTVEHPDKTINVQSWRAQLNWTEEYTFLGIAQRHCVDHQKR